MMKSDKNLSSCNSSQIQAPSNMEGVYSCCYTRRKYAILSAVYSAISSLVFVILMCARNFNEGFLAAPNDKLICGILSLVLWVAVFLSSILLLLFAIPEKDTCLFLPWIASSTMYLLVTPIVYVVMIVITRPKGEIDNLDIGIGAFLALNLILYVVGFFCVFMHYLRLKEKEVVERTASDMTLSAHLDHTMQPMQILHPAALPSVPCPTCSEAGYSLPPPYTADLGAFPESTPGSGCINN